MLRVVKLLAQMIKELSGMGRPGPTSWEDPGERPQHTSLFLPEISWTGQEPKGLQSAKIDRTGD